MLWLLAESWGHVTSVGTTLPLSLTHDVLGELIGARRSTVTLALTELSDRGAIVRQDRGWLLLEPPPTGAETPSEIADPSLLVDVGSSWAAEETHPMLGAEASRTELRETVARLRQEHRHRVERYEQRIGRLSLARQRAGDSRRRITQEATARRRAPSS
jgi:DNA-binding transcriptional MocR family regulator